MYEDAVSEEVMSSWVESTDFEFSPRDAHDDQVPYPNSGRAKCDLVFSTDGNWSNPEWAIEVKRIQLVGDNGKNNDYGAAKILSPYLKDRSLVHDIQRLRANPLARRQAVIGYVFTYDFDSVREALHHHPNEEEVLNNLRDVLRSNDPVRGLLNGLDIVEVADVICLTQEIVTGPVLRVPFDGLWRHPCGGSGFVFGWEVMPTSARVH